MPAVAIDELRGILEQAVAAEPRRRGTAGWWRRPLVAAAPADGRFDLLPRIAAPDHLLPGDTALSADQANILKKLKITPPKPFVKLETTP